MKHDCLSPVNMAFPSEGPYFQHRRRNTPACRFASVCRSMKQWLTRRPGRQLQDYPGWKKHNYGGHDCNAGWGEVIPSGSPYGWHKRRGTPVCAYARRCVALAVWLRSGPNRLAAYWPGWPRQEAA